MSIHSGACLFPKMRVVSEVFLTHVFFFVGLGCCFKWSFPKSVERLKILEEHSPFFEHLGLSILMGLMGVPLQ